MGLLRGNPYGMRRASDSVPIIAEFGTTHHPNLWRNIFFSATTGCIRSTDAFIFKSERTRNLWRKIWHTWKIQFPSIPDFPLSEIITNGVECIANKKDDLLRKTVRQELGFSNDDVIYLAFSRIAPVSKLDLIGLIFLWKDVVENHPEAILVIAGAVISSPDFRLFPKELNVIARSIGVSDNVLILPNPFDRWEDARTALMSSADVFIHTTRGMEETCPNVILEAMAFGLPVIASNWASIDSLIEENHTGWLIDSYAANLLEGDCSALFGRPHHINCAAMEAAVVIDAEQFLNAVHASCDKEIRVQFGLAARETASKKFDLGSIVEKRAAFIEAVSLQVRPVASLHSFMLFDLQKVIDGLASQKAPAEFAVELSADSKCKSYEFFIYRNGVAAGQVLKWIGENGRATRAELWLRSQHERNTLSTQLTETHLTEILVSALNSGFIKFASTLATRTE